MAGLRCSNCLVTLERLRSDGIADYLVRIVREDGENMVCPVCFSGW